MNKREIRTESELHNAVAQILNDDTDDFDEKADALQDLQLVANEWVETRAEKTARHEMVESIIHVLECF